MMCHILCEIREKIRIVIWDSLKKLTKKGRKKVCFPANVNSKRWGYCSRGLQTIPSGIGIRATKTLQLHRNTQINYFFQKHPQFE